MLQIQVLRDNPEFIVERLKARNFDAAETVTEILELDKAIKGCKNDFETHKAESNQLAKQIGMLFKNGEASKANGLKARTAELKELNKSTTDKQAELEGKIQELLYSLPNTPHSSVPIGLAADDNQTIYEESEINNAQEANVPHWDLAKQYDIIDFELGNKVAGAGFPFYKGKGAMFQRALINFFLTEAGKAGYTEFQTPLMVNEASGYGTGQLPDKEGQMYHMKVDNLYMIPTAEVPLTNMFRDTIVQESELPIKVTAYTPCFRREAGSYGKDVRGLNRLHQFDKVEIVQVANPDQSYQVLEEMLEHAKSLLTKLGLKYRVLRLCSGDMGFTSALTYDLEVYASGQNKWLEVSSVSNFETFQANRLKLRFKNAEGKSQLVHTLNGSALALPRIVAALLENNRTEKGIKIPEVLQPFTGFSMID